jgi:hypothetical protein
MRRSLTNLGASLSRPAIAAFALAAAATVTALAMLVAAGSAPPARSANTARPDPSVLTANVWVSRAGSDDCTRSPVRLAYAQADGHICRHWDAAYQAASSEDHDIVRVIDGVYESTYWTTGPVDAESDLDSYLIRAGGPAKDRGRVTFSCGTPGSDEGVTFAQPASVIEGSGVTIDGGGDWRTSRPSCFRFRAVLTGWTGDSAWANRFVIKGSHLASLFIAGSHGAAAIDDEIGPSVDCHDSAWPVKAERCRNIVGDDEAYYYQRREGVPSPVGQTQYTAASDCSANPSDIVFSDDFIHDINGLGDRGTETHTGPIQNGGSPSGGCQVIASRVTLRSNLFENVIIGDFAPAGSDRHVTVENNWFGPNSSPATDGRCVPLSAARPCGRSHESPRAILPDERWGAGGSDWLIRFDTFATPGLDIADGFAYSNARIIGNLFLAGNVACGAGEFRFSYNVYAGGATRCPGSHQVSTRRRVVIDSVYSPTSSGLDLRLAGPPGSTIADGFVTPTGRDFALATDFAGHRRSAPRDAGASER